MLKQWLKKSIIWKLKNWMFETVYYPQHLWLKSTIKKSEQCILLVGTPLYDNLGDHLIAEKELEWLEEHYPGFTIVEIPTPIFFRYEKYLSREIDRKVKVFITGGGWMGDVWPDDEKRLQKMISCFCHNQLTVFPQTVFYKLQDKESEELLNHAKAVYAKCKCLTLHFRDLQSYEFAKKNFVNENTKIKFTPDITLYNFYSNVHIRDKVIGVCLRQDRESNRYLDLENNINQWIKSNRYSKINYSTIAKFYVPIWLRRTMISRLIRQLEYVDIVVTDRLHGMIIALLAGCKCIALDNMTHKVSGVYNKWLSQFSKVQLLGETDGCGEMNKMLDYFAFHSDDVGNFVLVNLNDKFEIMEE